MGQAVVVVDGKVDAKIKLDRFTISPQYTPCYRRGVTGLTETSLDMPIIRLRLTVGLKASLELDVVSFLRKLFK